ncbi:MULTISPECIES: hypothetical protein [Bacillus cereus group]|uniref:Uncharacterized protein n=2 Tax=Bacillus cereus group TaxID=86661 RepID=A0A9X6ZQ25_BACTU|nr:MULTISPECIES: hypothetical protein [Bacillus cereus group]MDA1674559.1 hypothetical protein [Bacillus cereus group sp. TH152-1LC]PDZ94785.1 hypothetical protein CON36_31930 [Bacillus cereus]PFJ30258.1 hypothetical protein COJ15_31115 [Bacillus thuringiensis]PGP12499.1 hypothetical protein COA01_32290 [Bacillus cereus]
MKLKSTTFNKIIYSLVKKSAIGIFNFAKRNKKAIKYVSGPFVTMLFIFFAFSGFLMNDIMHPYFIAVSKVVTMFLACILLLYCIWDLIKSILIGPITDVFEREKDK